MQEKITIYKIGTTMMLRGLDANGDYSNLNLQNAIGFAEENGNLIITMANSVGIVFQFTEKEFFEELIAFQSLQQGSLDNIDTIIEGLS